MSRQFRFLLPDAVPVSAAAWQELGKQGTDQRDPAGIGRYARMGGGLERILEYFQRIPQPRKDRLARGLPSA